MAEAVVKKLPAPVVAGGKPLMETIGERKTIREFKAQNVDDQTLSEILWVAFGISHDGKRTIPTAMNQQNLKVYVVRNDGAWLYDAAENSLTQVTAENLQPLFATQDFMKDVPVNLVYVGSDEKYSPMHAGSAYQNVGLYAASKGMHSVVRGYFDNDRVTKALNLENGERAIVSQAIGKTPVCKNYPPLLLKAGFFRIPIRRYKSCRRLCHSGQQDLPNDGRYLTGFRQRQNSITTFAYCHIR